MHVIQISQMIISFLTRLKKNEKQNTHPYLLWRGHIKCNVSVSFLTTWMPANVLMESTGMEMEITSELSIMSVVYLVGH